MKYVLVALHNLASDFFAVPQAVKDCPDEEIAESNRRAFLESPQSTKMELIKADDLDLCIIGSFEDTTGLVTSCEPRKIANIGEWIRDYQARKGVKVDVQQC